MKHVSLLIALAVACLLVTPALSAADGKGYARGCGQFLGDYNTGCHGANTGGYGAGPHGVCMLLIDDATRDNFQNMTLAEIDALKQQKMQELQNMTLAQIDALKQQKMQELGNMTLSELKEQGAYGAGMHGMRSFDGTGPRRYGSCILA